MEGRRCVFGVLALAQGGVGGRAGMKKEGRVAMVAIIDM
jgi:hypothetical protein